MLMSRKSLGLELSATGFSFALAGGGKVPTVEAGLTLPFAPGLLTLSRRDPNVTDPKAFVTALKEAHLRLLTKERSVCVSLPDAVGRVVLLDLEARFKNREEGLDVIRWKLKKSLPFDISAVHLDYQTLEEKENGAVSLLVSLISRPVVQQYEELLSEAGLEAKLIDFTSFNLYRLFQPRLDLSEDGAFVTFYQGAMTVLIFNGGVLSFYRTKEGVGEVQNLFREVNSSFLVYGDQSTGQSVSEVFCAASPGDAESFRALVAEASGLEPVLLDMERLVRQGSTLGLDRPGLHALAGALGAALRSL
ncbi:pilus assembly protein PilM [Geomonas sp. Red421]|uniref:Pilus assembly protein PilM n=2 Tax=Geomonas anaerohicana TaxID=2798583 RepID=A0ABS0YAI3_9BACT|nr:pilus assembly protein PilM [Geomonas anaerohicana]